LTPVR